MIVCLHANASLYIQDFGGSALGGGCSRGILRSSYCGFMHAQVWYGMHISLS